MKTLLLPAVCLVILGLTSCEKTSTAPEMQKQAEEKLMGKWMVTRIVNEVYDPLPSTLASTTEYTGTTADYHEFINNGRVKVSSAVNGQLEGDFQVFNPFQVFIINDYWRIEELTGIKLQIVKDRNDGSQNKRFVTRIYLSR